MILKAREKEAIFKMKQKAATIIQTCFKRYKAVKVLNSLKKQKRAGEAILRLLKRNLEIARYERGILRKAKITASAYKL